jgi:uncharacterized membrane protein YcaP (DUF421 family)
MRIAKITLNELLETIREHGVGDISEVDLAILEVDGNISVLSHNYKKQSTRRRKAHKMISKQN